MSLIECDISKKYLPSQLLGLDVLPDSIDVDSLKVLLKKNKDIKEELTSDMCTSCGGFCCKSMGCGISPEDIISVDYDTIKKLLDTGFVSIDCCSDEDEEEYCNTLFLRMRNIGADAIDISADCGMCSILTQTGCSLDFEYRPKNGRTLSLCFSEDANTKQYNKLDCIKDWYQYNDILLKIIDESQEEYNED